MSEITLAAPPKATDIKVKDTKQIIEFLNDDLPNYHTNLYQFLYFLWQRTGGYTSSIPDGYVNAKSATSVDNSNDKLLEYTLKANTIKSVGQRLSIEGFGTFAANTNNKKIQLYFGSVLVIDSSSLAFDSGTWDIKATVIWASSSLQKIICTLSTSNPSICPTVSKYVTGNENLTKDILIKFVATGMQGNDIVQESLIIEIN